MQLYHPFDLDSLSLIQVNSSSIIYTQTFLLGQILHTVSHPIFLFGMAEIVLRGRLNRPLLQVLCESHVLQALLDIEAEVAVFIEMFGPSPNELSLGLLGVRRNAHERLGEKPENLVFDWFGSGDENEAFAP